MSGVKFYNGSAWAAGALNRYNGSAFVVTPVKIRLATGEWYTIGSGAAAGVINAMDYCHGDGTTDDTGHLTTAADAAILAGKALYLPTNVYKVTNWSPPENLTIIGDGGYDHSSHIKGRVNWASGQTYEDLLIGDTTTEAISFGDVYDTTSEVVRYTRCKFRGGGSGNATLHHPASYRTVCRDFVFDHCEWECNYLTTYTQAAQDVSWFIDRSSGDITEDIHFNYCHFGTINGQGRTGGIFGGVVFWSSWNDGTDSYDQIPDKTDGYYDDIYFDRCIFERADIWNLDMSGVQYCPRASTEGTVTITNNVFKGLSGEYHSEYSTRIVAQIEPGFDSVVTGNIFGIGKSQAYKVIKSASRNVLDGNIFDYRTDAQRINEEVNLPLIDSIAGINRVIRSDSGSYPNTYTDNKLLLPLGKYTTLTQQGWLYDIYSSTTTGNTVSWATVANDPGPIDDVEDLDFLPTGWTAPIGEW